MTNFYFYLLLLATSINLFCNANIVQISDDQLNLGVELETVVSGGKGDNSSGLKPTNVFCAVNPLVREENQEPYSLKNVNTDICTHLLVNWGRIDQEFWNIYVEGQGANQLRSLKLEHPLINIILAIGGWDEGVKKFQAVSRNLSIQSKFIKSIEDELERKNDVYSGIAINWMWPALGGYRGGEARDKDDLTLLIKNLHASLQQRNNKSLSLVVNGLPSIAQEGYDLNAVEDHVDYFLLLAQDYCGKWQGTRPTCHPSPLFGDTEGSVESITNHVLQFVPSSKVIIGIPFFGRQFLLTKNTTGTGYNEPFNGGFEAHFRKSDIDMGYAEICHSIRDQKGWTVFYDEEKVAMFMRNGQKWVGFDGLMSVKRKLQFGMEKGVGGFMAWTVDTDDFNGRLCGGNIGLLGALAPPERFSSNPVTKSPQVDPPSSTTKRPKRSSAYSSLRSSVNWINLLPLSRLLLAIVCRL